MSKPSPQQIEDIVHRRAPAPPGYRYLTDERQVAYLERRIAELRNEVDPTKVVESEVVATDTSGKPKIDKEGFPVSRKIKLYARDLVAKDEIQLLDQARAHWREMLQLSQEDRARAGEDLQRELERKFGDPKSWDAHDRRDAARATADFWARLYSRAAA